MQILMEYGGIYLDLDVLVLNPFDDLRRQYECTIGRELDNKSAALSSFVRSTRYFSSCGSTLISMITGSDEWAYNTGKVRTIRKEQRRH
jgi:hypothetical protein